MSLGRRVRALTVTALIGAAIAAPVALHPTPAAAAEPGAILFEDDFTGAAGASFDRTKWEDFSVETYNSSAAYGNIKPGDNETLNGSGQLVIPAKPGAGSAIRTGAKFGFVYGTMSAWVKQPAEAGYWPAFWSLNNNTDGRDVLPLGEADAMEFYSTWPEAYHAVGHTWGSPSYHGTDHYCPAANLTSGFHKYSARIEPGRVTFLLDDVQCGQVYTKDPGKQWGFGPDVMRPNWLILNLANDSRSGAEVVAPTQPAQLLVDRVEVRALPSAVAAPVAPPVTAPVTPPVAAPVTPPVAPPVAAPVAPPVTAPIAPPVTAPVAPPVANGTYRLVNACSRTAIDAPAGRGNLKTAADSGAASQQWRVSATSGGHHKLINVAHNTTMSLPWTSSADGVALSQYYDNGSPNAEFKLIPVAGGAYQLINRTSSKAVAVRGDATGVGVAIEQVTPDAARCGQRWSLVSPVPTVTASAATLVARLTAVRNTNPR
ncbi:RICIN domain-containing protein [Modestobacter sp. VKM Ac-2986]|uniref:RICIN domain-containing protein n=1 Tax=Modestobacter sp. VKM Ac-2986 TaxID=3004140 RepID=UPI0022AA4F9D|nr:RICIN domain-containing protein [Modestobacter sp. VKM Ac-2986]MCZ2828473.1 RICIN domain-containing protein [Modestobacter sp. VKM Ac-2986]